MPAYRSEAEAEIRTEVVAHLRRNRPEARIIHEINAWQLGNRIDVLAVSPAEIVAVEIKSARDKLHRLEDQMRAMQDVAHHAYAAIHEKFLVEQRTNQWAAHYERDGQYFMRNLPDDLRRMGVWVYPRKRRAVEGGFDGLERWNIDKPALNKTLPAAALDMLWRDELYQLCGNLRIAVPKRATRRDMMDLLRWLCAGRELTTGICRALRRRECVEADSPIIDSKEVA
ncbi:hypothetical protein [Fodinicurvata fenggangensis]|uniref:hypothetical protein n=1 Tax=Fodinicurvata fenggangensis TaxID=1121830 RepID=UPI00047E0069|nr:hypothetical protein [Fodinicurvata fenggangensis]